jgi:transcriptional regulator with XRE-family HTH domain
MTGDDLRDWIKSRNISDREAARQLGCSPNGLRRWLRGTTPVPLYVALACAAIAYGLPPWRRPAVIPWPRKE